MRGYSEHTAEYTTYMNSPEWRRRRSLVLLRDKKRCAVDALGATTPCSEVKGLEVHHRSYERLGAEQWDDLITLCSTHHRLEHLATNSHALYEARLEGWATRKYGEGWDDDYRLDPSRIEDEFDGFLREMGEGDW